MAVPDRNYIKKLFIEFLFIWFNNLKFVEKEESFFFFLIYNINFAAHWTLLPRAPASFPPPPPFPLTYTTAKFLRCDLYTYVYLAPCSDGNSRYFETVPARL